MGIAISLLLIAVGAILRFAVTDTVSGVDLETVGLILGIVGIIGLILSVAVTVMRDRGSETVVTRERYVEPPSR